MSTACCPEAAEQDFVPDLPSQQQREVAVSAIVAHVARAASNARRLTTVPHIALALQPILSVCHGRELHWLSDCTHLELLYAVTVVGHHIRQQPYRCNREGSWDV